MNNFLFPETLLGKITTVGFWLLVAFNIFLVFGDSVVSKRKLLILNIVFIAVGAILTRIDSYLQETKIEKLTSQISALNTGIKTTEARKFKKINVILMMNISPQDLSNQEAAILPQSEVYGLFMRYGQDLPVWKYEVSTLQQSSGHFLLNLDLNWDKAENKDIVQMLSKIKGFEIQMPIAVTTLDQVIDAQILLNFNPEIKTSISLKNMAKLEKIRTVTLNGREYRQVIYDLNFNEGLLSHINSTLPPEQQLVLAD